MKVLIVRLNGVAQGMLNQDAVGRLAFTYAPTATRRLSLAMPLREAAYDNDACEAYFGGLLPESETARKAIAGLYGANANNSFSLLQAIGHDCAGAVSLHHPDDGVTEPTDRLDVLSEASLAAHIRNLPKKPLFLGAGGLRLSLAGAQDKAAVCLVDGQIALGTPTTHILKPAIAGVGETVINETLCMRLAKAVGLDVPTVEMRSAEGIPYLLVERYDRVRTQTGGLARIHQEDFCQALGVRSSLKYQSDGGPSAKDCFALTLRLNSPAVARNQLLALFLFNVLIGNGDAHAKNYSLIHETDSVRLAPAYDLVCTRFYPDLSTRMAMKIGGHYEPERLYNRQWQSFCDDIGISYPQLRRQLQGLADALQTAIQAEGRQAQAPEAERVLTFLASHAQAVVQRAHMG